MPQRAHGRGALPDMVSIRDRPANVTERTEIGHGEGGLVMRARPSAVAALLERLARFVRVVPLPDGFEAAPVRSTTAADLALLPPALRKTLTWDRGREMAEQQGLATDLGIGVYFCEPRSPWHRGSNENTNRLLRRHLAKGADLRQFTAADLDGIADRINKRPRRMLNWASSTELLQPHLGGMPDLARHRLVPVPAIDQPPVDLMALERR